MADRLVQKNAWPSGPEHHIHLAGRRCYRLQSDDALPQRFLHRRLPVFFAEESLVARPPAHAIAAAFLALAAPRHHGDVEADEGSYISCRKTVRSQDFDELPFSREGNRNLSHPAVEASGECVRIANEFHLCREIHRADRVQIGIEFAIGHLRRQRQGPAAAAGHRLHRFRRPL